MIRNGAAWVVTHKRFDHFIVTLIMINSLLLGIKSYTDVENTTTRNKIVEGLDPYFTAAFTIECALKVIGMGFLLDDGSYMRDPWNWLDFIVVVSSLLTEIPQMKSVSGMRTFRLMRPLRSLTTMPSMKILISTLLSSVAQLGGVLILAIFFFTIFAILGVSLWKGKIYNRCRMTEFPVNGDWEVDPQDTLLCSEVRECNENRYCGSLAVAIRSTEPRMKINSDIAMDRDSKIEDLNYSYSNFNNLASAFLTIFQCITLEGWIDVTNMYRSAYSSVFVQIYFLLCVIVCSFFVLNLTIAVMLLKYEEADNEVKDDSHTEELKEIGDDMGLPEEFTEFLIEQENIQVSLKGMKLINKAQNEEDENQQHVNACVRAIKKVKAAMKYMFTCTEPMPDPSIKYYSKSVTRAFFYIVNIRIFDAFINIIILLNTIVLAMDKYPEWDEDVNEFFHLTNTVFTIIFTAEVAFKLIGLGAKGYVADKFNIFDCVIVIISLVDMFAASESGEDGAGDAIAALRAFRLFRIFKIFRSGDLRTLLDSIGFTVLTIKDYAILLALFIYVFALLGMSFFAGKIKFNEEGDYDLKNGVPNRINFETLYRSGLSVFMVMIGENWNSMMYDAMRSVGVGSCLYYIMLVIMGNIIMLNLFLAILLGNFDRARGLGEKKKVFDAFNNLLKQEYELTVAIGLLFDDQDFTKYIEDKVLNQPEKKADDGEAALKDEEEDEHKTIYQHTEEEIEIIFLAMSLGTIEQYLNGENSLEDHPNVPDDMPMPPSMSDLQRKRTIEILTYIKRQHHMRKQRMEFHD